MQSGRILPTFRQFFAITPKPGDAHRDSNPQQGRQEPAERDATEEEARRAAELLSESEEFLKNGIKVIPGEQGGRIVLFVVDGAGKALRSIQGLEILKVLAAFGSPRSPRQGRILDRRI